MIRTIIAMSDTGLPYFSGNYVCQVGMKCDVMHKDKVVETQNPMLLSGFFNALQSMAKTGGGELQVIEFEKFKFIALAKDKVVMIFSVDIDDNTDEYKNRVQIALDEFVINFGPLMGDNKLIDTKLFDGFQMLLEKMAIFDVQPKVRKNCIECNINQDCVFRMVKGLDGIDIKEKMAQFPRWNILRKMIGYGLELKKYWIQKRRYKKFDVTIKLAEKNQPKVDFANLILEKVKIS